MMSAAQCACKSTGAGFSIRLRQIFKNCMARNGDCMSLRAIAGFTVYQINGSIVLVGLPKGLQRSAF